MDRPNLLAQTVDAIVDTAVEPYEIIIVDNNSTTPEAVELLDIYDGYRAQVIRNQANLGLSVATNQGFNAAQFDCLIHMDDDCLVRHVGWNKVMEGYLDNPKIGMVVPYRTPLSIQQDGYREITWGLGMVWAIRRSLFEDIGGYDPQLLHQNECDMALRVRLAGLHVAAIEDFTPIHNDPNTTRSEMAVMREHLGCVQFRDKWTSYFRGRAWNYGTDPVYLMQHWPPDQEFFQRFAEANGVILNPAPDTVPLSVEQWDSHANSTASLVHVAGDKYLVARELRNNYAHWEHRINPELYSRDRDMIIERWFQATGERYEGYRWPVNLLRPY